MKKIPSKQYTEEFKREAVRLVLEQGLSASEVGRRLDVPNQSDQQLGAPFARAFRRGGRSGEFDQ